MRRLRRLLYSAARFFNRLAFSYSQKVSLFILKMNGVNFEKDIKIWGIIHVRNHGRMTIGKGVIINSSQRSNPSTHAHSTFITVDERGVLNIGDGVGISHAIIRCRESVQIERDVMIGSGCIIYDTDFHSADFTDRIVNRINNDKCKPVRICQGAWLGANTMVTKGVTVGEHSVIGACSVVTKDVPPNEIWAGNPAGFIRKINS